ncbi:MAG: DUF3419 family protein [Planctomycetaceae bacterium]
MQAPVEEIPAGRIDERTSFHFIRYANCWEDADILCEALAAGPGKRILSIASAGDNVLALLATGAEVVAADLSGAQLACLELRCVAFRRLDYDDLLAFLGLHADENRLETFDGIKRELTSSALAFWEQHRAAIAAGIVHAGKFENYFRVFRKWVLPLIHSRRTVARLLEPKTLEEQKSFWDTTWNNRRWRFLFRLFFGRTVMGKLGRDPEFFRYVEGSVADRILERTRYALTMLPTHDNPYLEYIAQGNFARALPRYLRPEHFAAIRDGLDRLTIHQGSIEEAGTLHKSNGFDGFNLSDIFEYVDVAKAEAMYGEFLSVANPGARLAYWNTLVPRACPEPFRDRIRPLDDLSRELFARDRAFFYCHFQVDEVGSSPGI